MAASLSFLILLIAFRIPLLSHGDPRLDIVARACATRRVQHPKKYFKTYADVVDHMQYDMYRNKFAFRESGAEPDRVYVMSQCFDDLSSVECAECFARISNLLPSCFPATGGRVYLDGCFIRADNYSFYREFVENGDMKRCSNDVATGVDFNKALTEVLKRVVSNAPTSGGFAFYPVTEKDTTVYGMAQCWKTLDSKMCSACLTDAASSAFNCMPAAEGRALNAGCFFRYSNYRFGNNPDAILTQGAITSYISYILAAVMVCTMAVGLGFYLGKFAYKKMNRREERNGNDMDLAALDNGTRFLQFKYSTLEQATECFNETLKLGSGAFGEVFKGTLPDGREIAVKRLYVSGTNRTQEIYNEVDVISRAQHKNLVHFLGCCFTKMESFLVYEFLANRSLDGTLFHPEKKKELNWKRRFGIIMGTAEGLEYLHKDCLVRIIHRDIKASNILLDLKYRPKIADFGLARFYSVDGNSFIGNAVAGTFGYMAPEYIAKGRLTEKVDVYSFGVLVLEIVSGIKNTKLQSDNSFETLVTYAWRHFQSNTTSEIIDECLETENIEEISRVIQVGLLCTQETPSLRPTMTRVTKMLRNKDFELATPTKPPFMDEYIELSSSLASSLGQHSVPSDDCRRRDSANDP